MTRTALILVAAGKGTRAGSNIPKQYHEIGEQPLIAHTLNNIRKSHIFNEIRVVVSSDDIWIDGVLESLDLFSVTTLGGATRTESVRAGLQSLVNLGIEHVYIHDAARPFVSSPMMQKLSEALKTYQGAAPALPIADALKTLEGDSVDRDQLQRVQTPQAFHFNALFMAYRDHAKTTSFADDIAVARKAGLSIAFTPGDPDNFKVTYPEDFAKAARMIDTSYIATGSGFDVHQFDHASAGPLWLCGVPIDCGYTLLGHSDADAGLHALTDAILGALCFGDIGDHFPPSDPKWKGAASDKFLRFAIEKLRERQGVLQHVDVTLICEMPKIKPHREAMRKRISELCTIPLSRVSVKATTTETLGFTGRGEGLAAQATATVKFRA
ncbi:bifunctional enzyme IspD/IspF [Litorimonas cladophorae]|uniref:Bifunctional enzyme IspD/IspF n=1 Tax=Litorimonas cladophorae TaxID=1220491 RepID=A0A918KC22_9PROT|nr:bifunctional 2-C-methyl-D-erythritol 4-phosphate cytidylyltransferase/2-C-methyl-D-erythritol 2,4-cyclodiphosphate synthase [Litorimonas cladophorae]GGX57985.1 bifunctional enzyme IspD/IspF [Litorimonas cladophorae]